VGGPGNVGRDRAPASFARCRGQPKGHRRRPEAKAKLITEVGRW